MANVLVIVALIFILANLFLILMLFFLFFRAFFKFIGEDTLNNWNLEGFVPNSLINKIRKGSPSKQEVPGEMNEEMAYTPTEGIPGGEVPLDQFVPDFKKPITIKYEESGDEHGLSVDGGEEDGK